MNYSNGKTPSPGDIVAVNINGVISPFLVVALAPVALPNAGVANPPSEFLAAVPFKGLDQVNLQAAEVELWSDYTTASPVH